MRDTRIGDIIAYLVPSYRESKFGVTSSLTKGGNPRVNRLEVEKGEYKVLTKDEHTVNTNYFNISALLRRLDEAGIPMQDDRTVHSQVLQ